MSAVAVEMPPRTRGEMAWQDRARCVEVDPELFFPDHAGVTGEEAKQVCGLCEVRGECLAYALARPALDGVWGGTSFRQRQKIRVGRA